ncbi:MAG: DUF4190 domain-containing protein [Oscillospiraceae bacterium]|nr:DUF4190 domain-containing protein [Oscillospiraceae bacterium]
MNSYNNYPGQNQPQWNPQTQQWTPVPPQQPRDNGGFAIASFVIGLVGLLLNFCCLAYITPIMGILSLIFGIVSIRSSKKGMAIAGIILGAFTILFAIFILVGLFAAVGYDGNIELFFDELFYEMFGEHLYY